MSEQCDAINDDSAELDLDLIERLESDHATGERLSAEEREELEALLAFEAPAPPGEVNLIDLVGRLVDLEPGNLIVCPDHHSGIPYSAPPDPDWTSSPPWRRVFADHYYCFVCGASGDAFDLIQELQGCNLSDAIDWIVEETGDFPLQLLIGAAEDARSRGDFALAANRFETAGRSDLALECFWKAAREAKRTGDFELAGFFAARAGNFRDAAISYDIAATALATLGDDPLTLGRLESCQANVRATLALARAEDEAELEEAQIEGRQERAAVLAESLGLDDVARSETRAAASQSLFSASLHYHAAGDHQLERDIHLVLAAATEVEGLTSTAEDWRKLAATFDATTGLDAAVADDAEFAERMNELLAGHTANQVEKATAFYTPVKARDLAS